MIFMYAHTGGEQWMCLHFTSYSRGFYWLYSGTCTSGYLYIGIGNSLGLRGIIMIGCMQSMCAKFCAHTHF